MQAHDLVSLPGVLALEISADGQPERLSLERDEADQLATHFADDLRKLLPGIDQARLAVIGAHFDSAELLRPGFPAFATLEQLLLGVEGGVVAFGTRDGHMPAQTLVPETNLAGASLRLVPWTIMASPAQAEELGPLMEKDLVGKGEVGTVTADYLMRTFGMRLEHARFFSRHDLLALVCVHYEHANLAPLWTLIETALLSPERDEQTVSAHGLGWRFAADRASAQTPGQWLAGQKHGTPQERAHALAGIVFELRQYVAMLGAHHIAMGFASGQYVADDGYLLETRESADPTLGAPTLYAHEARGLGVIAVAVVQAAGNTPRVLAQAWILGNHMDAACRHLAETWHCGTSPERLGEICLDADGLLAAPAATTH